MIWRLSKHCSSWCFFLAKTSPPIFWLRQESNVKYIFVGMGGLLATFLCFLLMTLLVTSEIREVSDLEAVKISVRRHLSIPLKKREVRKRPELVVPAQPPLDKDASPRVVNSINFLVKSPLPTFGSMAEFLEREARQFDLLPPISDFSLSYMVQPVYPFKAVMKEIEGFVLIQFSIRENGTVMNPFVVESEPRSLFDEAALSAITKFKFHPRMVAGDPRPVMDMKIKFAFELNSDDTGSYLNVDGNN